MPRDTTLTMQASSAVCSPAADNLLREVSQHDFNARMRFFLGIRVRPEQFVSLVRKLDARSRRLQGVILRTHSFDWTLTKVTCGLLLNRKSSPETRLHRVQPRWHGAAVPEWTEETGGVRSLRPHENRSSLRWDDLRSDDASARGGSL